MNVETPAEGLHRLRTRLYDISERGEITVDEIALPGPDRPLTIGVVGIFSTGKSTFLNALIGKQLLPVSLGPKTAIPMYITRTAGDELAELVTPKGHPTITTLEKAISEGVLPDGADLEDIENFVSRIKLREIRLKLHLPELFEGVQLIDTPGLDSPYEEHELLAIRVLRECDVVLYLLDEVVKDADRSALLIGQKHCSRFIFLQTKVDRARPESSWDVTAQANADVIAAIIGRPVTVLPVSARMTMQTQDSEEPQEWGMPRVREHLAQALNDRRRLLSIADAKRLLTAGEDALQHSESRTTSLRGDDDAFQQRIADLADRVRLARMVNTRLDPLLAEAGRVVTEFSATHISDWREELRAAMLPVRKGHDVVEQVRAAALTRTSLILERDAEDAVRRAVTLADGRALNVLFETFGIDVAGPLRGHPQIDVTPPTPRRGWFNRVLDFLSGQESISEGELRKVADEMASSLQRELLAAVNASLSEAFSQYLGYVQAAVPNIEAERSALENQRAAASIEREANITRSAETTRELRELRNETRTLLDALEASLPKAASASF